MDTRFKKLRHYLFGPDLNPLKAGKNKSILLIAFFAWIGLGADGLSSSCYGPEEAFLALGQHTELGLWLALATAFTVFIIAISYNQVIELFPSGGGGYKVATTLIGPYAGLVSGSALIVDYILTITISVASGFDALFSLLPMSVHDFKNPAELFFILFLGYMNLRGAKESIQILMPIFLGFIITHAFIIIGGIGMHADRLDELLPNSVNFTQNFVKESGWFFVVALFLRAYSLGGGTYTGIEAVSNNINILAEPRVATGKWTMFYMAVSLSFTAGGIILLYLLWQVSPIEGQTLNAVTFNSILSDLSWANADLRWVALITILFFEAGLLFVAANTGYLGGPQVLANMAVDGWMPNQFKHLSTRLVTQNGILFMGIAAILILLITRGQVAMLVVLYSINVFITFTLSLLGLVIFWWNNRGKDPRWISRLSMSVFGFLVCASILLIIVAEKFLVGGWITLFITSLLIGICLLIKKHYQTVKTHLERIFKEYEKPHYLPTRLPPTLDPKQPTAVIIIDENQGLGMHTLHRILSLFPNVYKNFVFLGIGQIESDILRRDDMEKELLRHITESLRYFVNYCHHHLGLPATSFYAFGTDTIETAVQLADEKIKPLFKNPIFFSGEVLFENETWFTRWLYDHTPEMIQEALHFKGYQMVLLPMTLSI